MKQFGVTSAVQGGQANYEQNEHYLNDCAFPVHHRSFLIARQHTDAMPPSHRNGP
jgi:hypothetical protein